LRAVFVEAVGADHVPCAADPYLEAGNAVVVTEILADLAEPHGPEVDADRVRQAIERRDLVQAVVDFVAADARVCGLLDDDAALEIPHLEARDLDADHGGGHGAEHMKAVTGQAGAVEHRTGAGVQAEVRGSDDDVLVVGALRHVDDVAGTGRVHCRLDSGEIPRDV